MLTVARRSASQAILVARVHHGGSAAGRASGSGSSHHGGGHPGGNAAFATMASTRESVEPLRSPGKPLSERVKRLAAAFTRGDPGGDGGSATDSIAAGA
jgi:hypothetical protein